MVVRVDHDAKKIRMVSIFRDCMMNIDGHGYQKVTHAHAFGGPELAVDTLNKNLDLDIKNYVTVNFNTVGEIVDEVGGIVQDIDASEAKVINGYIDEVNKVRGTSSSHIDSAGTYTLDGIRQLRIPEYVIQPEETISVLKDREQCCSRFLNQLSR